MVYDMFEHHSKASSIERCGSEALNPANQVDRASLFDEADRAAVETRTRDEF